MYKSELGEDVMTAFHVNIRHFKQTSKLIRLVVHYAYVFLGLLQTNWQDWSRLDLWTSLLLTRLRTGQLKARHVYKSALQWDIKTSDCLLRFNIENNKRTCRHSVWFIVNIRVCFFKSFNSFDANILS